MGGIAGIVSRTAVAPLERLKILYQVQHITGYDGGKRKYGSVTQSLRTIYREEGIAGFYRGNGTNCVRVFPYVGTQFLCFETYKSLVLELRANKNGDTNTLTPLQKLSVGAMSGVSSVAVTYPLDFARGQLTAQGGATSSNYRGIVHVFTDTVKHRGVGAIYAGIKPSFIGIAPYVGVNYLVYEQLKELRPVEEQGALFKLVCGGIAGTSGQTVAYPMDLLRRRFQLQETLVSKSKSSRYYSGVGQAMRAIVNEEGFVGLYKGFVPNFFKVVPTIAIMFWVNDMLKQVLLE